MKPAPAPSAPVAAGLPFKRLLLVLGVVATAYAAALLVWGDSPKTSLALLWSWTGAQAAGLCLLNYLLRGLRWRLWMAHYGRHFGWLQGLRLYLAGYAFTPTPGNVGEAARGLMLARQPLGAGQSLAIFGAERLADLLCLLLLCLPAAGWVLRHPAVQAVSTLLGVLLAIAALVLLAVLGLLFKHRARLFERLPWLWEAWHCLALRPWLWLGLTLAAWAVQGVAVWLICRGMHSSPGLRTGNSSCGWARPARRRYRTFSAVMPAPTRKTACAMTGCCCWGSVATGPALPRSIPTTA